MFGFQQPGDIGNRYWA